MNFPLKVLCIDSKPRPGDVSGNDLKEGMQYTALCVREGTDFEGNTAFCYEIEGLSRRRSFLDRGIEGLIVFECDRFVPLSDQDEREYADKVLNEIFEPVWKE